MSLYCAIDLALQTTTPMRSIMPLLHSLIIAQLFILNNALLHSPKTNWISDADLTAPQLISKYGYPLEIHHVVTEDGYVLELHRIPYGQNHKPKSSPNSPVLILHNLAGSSADWVLFGPDRGLAYILADAGSDVWLGNNRGNVYSKKHVSIPPTDRRFWDFSYHELGVHDLSAIIDYVLNCTKYDKLSYVGHSQGTTQFFVLMSEKPFYNSKVSLMIALAPVAYAGHMRGFVTTLTGLTNMGVWVGEMYGYPEIRERSIWKKIVSKILCGDSAKRQYLCTNLMFVMAAFNKDNYDATEIDTIINHIPAGGSWKQIIHYGQGYIHKDQFRQFDYISYSKNYKLYNSSVPPDYELGRVTTPIAVFYSDDDVLATTQDVELLTTKLKNIVYRKKLKGFSHYDFVWGKNSTLLFKSVSRLLAQYKCKDNLNDVLI